MRVAVYHSLPSGGAKRTLVEQVKRLGERHELELFTLSGAEHTFCDLRPHVRRCHFYVFEPRPLLSSPFGRLNQLVRLADLVQLRGVEQRMATDIDAAQYDLVLVHPSRYTQSPWLLHFLSTPAVYYCHEPLRKLYERLPARPYASRSQWRRALDAVDVLDKLYYAVLRQVDRSSLRRATTVLTNSAFTQSAIAETYGVRAEVCYHGVDTALFRPLPVVRDGTVISVGSLTPLKGFDSVVEALATIPSAQRPRLNLVSNFQEAPEREYLEHLATDRGVQVRFHSMVDDQLLVQLYGQAVLTIYMPVREPFGMVALESMACGTPVVGVREGGVQESVVDGRTGFLVRRDPREVGSAVQRLLEDADLAKRYGIEGRRHVTEAWTWDQAVRRLEDLMCSALGGKAQSWAQPAV